jgi:hypothetical protein
MMHFLYNYLHTNFIPFIRHRDGRHNSKGNMMVNNNNNAAAELHLSGLNATASHPDM